MTVSLELLDFLEGLELQMVSFLMQSVSHALGAHLDSQDTKENMVLGEKGPQGKPGDDGAPGDEGADGSPGLPGPVGATGERGAPGNDARGTAKGAPGPQGEMGPAGMPGDEGLPGERGDDALPGPQGPPGAIGAPGEPGPVGFPGLPGQVGHNGNDAEYCPCPDRSKKPSYALPKTEDKYRETAPGNYKESASSKVAAEAQPSSKYSAGTAPQGAAAIIIVEAPAASDSKESGGAAVGPDGGPPVSDGGVNVAASPAAIDTQPVGAGGNRVDYATQKGRAVDKAALARALRRKLVLKA
ncbi:collagen triple helix repeat protein [Teladorsagia circumcincta]|uniref:Collagen triple helix repeat protein n=1 Tax=Teladorsagia circumcincta TaxID=45464 RepID=A0A2G9UIF9_TELCI|nr:collagen triple helix repeat protein [Teladorsagia circumcincta]